MQFFSFQLLRFFLFLSENKIGEEFFFGRKNKSFGFFRERNFEDNLFKFSELNDFALCNLNFLLDFILKADWGELFLDLFKDKGDFVGVAASLLLNDGAFVHINKRIFRKKFF